ncbi:primosomal replication protein N [Pasteurellaceae bacterium RH1A]|nr:primosomal replication protein N [Pasteurellaceae bacterium RH1A]
MLVENRLTLSGTVATAVKQSQSPAGIYNRSFYLEHRSNQVEAGLQRQAWCKIQVILNGNQFNTITQNITVGCKVRVSGFIHSHKDYQGLSQLVLHTEQIEFID